MAEDTAARPAAPRLFHFSDDPSIGVFEPRPVRTPASRPPGLDWLNGPLVWAIDEAHSPMYFFPRECPRVLLWPKAGSLKSDIDAFWGGSDARMLVFIEAAWADRHAAETLWRYEFTPDSFEDLGSDIGHWVSRTAAHPIARVRINDLPHRLTEFGAELRILPDLLSLRGAWDTTLHASGIRLRNAKGWIGAP
jgi:hypothetical protein